jgi:hypothetical protein
MTASQVASEAVHWRWKQKGVLISPGASVVTVWNECPFPRSTARHANDFHSSPSSHLFSLGEEPPGRFYTARLWRFRGSLPSLQMTFFPVLPAISLASEKYSQDRFYTARL